MTIAAGIRLGRYEIRSKIGEGGMGVVYLAFFTLWKDADSDLPVLIEAKKEFVKLK